MLTIAPRAKQGGHHRRVCVDLISVKIDADFPENFSLASTKNAATISRMAEYVATEICLQNP